VLNVCRQLERLAGFFRRGNKPQKLARFAPEILSFAPGDVFEPTGGPISDRSKNRGSLRRAVRLPEIGHDRLPRRVPLKAMRWDRKRFRADVFAKREQRVMP